MTSGGTDALRAEREVVLGICQALNDDEWGAPSGCDGWSVGDLVTHLAAGFWLVVDPSILPDTAGIPTEAAQELLVAARRSWSREQVVDDYISVSDQAIERLARFEGKDFEVPLGDLGTYPASLLPNCFVFDHYTHIRADLFPPRGPLSTPPPPSDEQRVGPTLDWISAALPQQNAELIASLPGTAVLDVRGTGARVIRVGSGPSNATVASDAPSFIRWITQRGTWEQLGVSATGDPDVIELVRQLRVF